MTSMAEVPAQKCHPAQKKEYVFTKEKEKQ